MSASGTATATVLSGPLLAELQAVGFELEAVEGEGEGEGEERGEDRGEVGGATKGAGANEAGAPAVAMARRGGAGPSDHRAVSLAGRTVMVPLRRHQAAPTAAPFRLRVLDADGAAPAVAGPTRAVAPRRGLLLRGDAAVAELELPVPPRFYALRTADGIPYSKIALLHAPGVLASTVMQSCVRYNDPAQACRFCAIGTSLAAGRTVARKSPAQLAEVAAAAVRLDGVTQLVLTTGTPASADRGAAHLAACAAAVKGAVPGLAIQAQCEPPDEDAWFARLAEAGVDALGMHLEAVEPEVRARVMPGKAEVSVDRYFEAFRAAVAVFGRGQVSTYLIAGLGDRPESLVATAARLLSAGVYPFVVPFVPIAGAPLAAAPSPAPAEMDALYREVGRLIREHGLFSTDMKAGCGKCGACSALSAYEVAS